MTEPNNVGDTITPEFQTFNEAAEMAGVSRVLGGYHNRSVNIAGLELGRNVAREGLGILLGARCGIIIIQNSKVDLKIMLVIPNSIVRNPSL